MIGREQPFQLLLDNRKTVTWNGKDGIDAAMRYVDAHLHGGAAVVAWREIRHGMFVGSPSD
jgi:hypothetical protein